MSRNRSTDELNSRALEQRKNILKTATRNIKSFNNKDKNLEKKVNENKIEKDICG